MKQSIEEAARRFDALADSYDRNADRLVRRAQDLVVRLAEPDPQDVILDVGCGTGTVAVALAAKVRRIIGIDVSDRMLDLATVKIERFQNVSFGAGSFQHLDESFDLEAEGITKIVSTFALHCLDPQEKRVAIEAMARALPVGGTILLADVMFFEDPQPCGTLCDPVLDEPATVRDLLALFRLAGTVPDAHRIESCVGVIRAVVSDR